MKTFVCVSMCFALFVSVAGAQDKKPAGLPKPAVDLEPGVYHYRVKLEAGGQVMNLKSSTTIQDGGASWTAIGEMEMPGGSVTDTTTIEKTTLIPQKRHLSRGPVVVDLDFSNGKATGKISMNGQESSIGVDMGGPLFADGAGANEAIASLPLAVGYSTTFRNFDIQTQRVMLLQLNVAGSESVTVPAGKFDAFRVDIASADGGSDKKTVWVAKDTRKVVKVTAVVAAMGGAVFTAELLGDEAISSSAQENKTAEKTPTVPATSQAAGVVTGVKIAPDHGTRVPGESRQLAGTVEGTGSFSTGLKPAVTSDQQRAVLNSTRVFWDPTYTDPRYADPDPDKFPKPHAPQMIPRMKNWVAANYPGTKTAISEYAWGSPEHISGAVAQADILGIFGREGLDLGALWGPPNLNSPLMFPSKSFATMTTPVRSLATQALQPRARTSSSLPSMQHGALRIIRSL